MHHGTQQRMQSDWVPLRRTTLHTVVPTCCRSSDIQRLRAKLAAEPRGLLPREGVGPVCLATRTRQLRAVRRKGAGGCCFQPALFFFLLIDSSRFVHASVTGTAWESLESKNWAVQSGFGVLSHLVPLRGWKRHYLCCSACHLGACRLMVDYYCTKGS